MQERDRILIVGGDDATRAGYLAELRTAGFIVDERRGVAEDSDGVDLVLVAGGAEHSRRDGFGAVVDAVTAARKAAGAAAVLACVPRGDDVDAASDAIAASLASGADDVVVCPPIGGALVARVRAGLKMSAARLAVERFERYGDALAHIGGSVGITLETPEAMHDLLCRIVEAVSWTRVALMLFGEEPNAMVLISASDDPSSMKVPLTLERYPELRACLESREPVLVEDARSSALLGSWAELAAEKGGAALLAVPLMVERKVAGALLLRHELARPPLGPRAIDFLRLASSLLGLVLKSGGVFEGLREQTRRMSMQRYAEERRTRALEQYKDFFEASTDGMLVADSDGTILSVNRAAEQMTGWAREGLVGRNFTELVAPGQRMSLTNILRQVANGANLEVFDLSLSTTSGESLTVSVSSSSVLSEHQSTVVAFRDVTEARALEAELRKTKDFLERLIDSTVDGIISADMRGNVLIFNQGAARLYGYSPDEVIGKLPVWKLYPDGVARAIMSELRALDHGGTGRLEPSRREIVTKEGELVPISLAASIVYEDGREMATVGIISDLRDRIKMEQRLAQAQEKLVVTEKQALIAELAGTTAHELNQPLTSVMGYSELLKKKMSPNDVHYRAVDIILREAERMAEIVRKIGKITRYETKAYVGSTQILDLDKSTTDG
ncbi:MAG: putative sensor protein [Myxococcales bacterium]|nr:putative sensor protein [Myxococcales bacterium]